MPPELVAPTHTFHSLVQLGAWADNLRNILKQSTGRSFQVRPVVLLQGWFVEDKPPKGALVWVLEPKQLPGWMRQEPVTISESDLSLATHHLSRHVRTFKREGS